MKKRRNEIIDAGIEYTLQNRPMCICGDAFFEDMREMNRNKTYEEAAKWADKTMIERAIYILSDLSNDGCLIDIHNFEEFEKQFRKKMEE
jgi:hypothetical protein